MKTRTTFLAILSAGLVALSALAVPVLAQDDNETSDSSSGSHRPGDRPAAQREQAEARREAAKERAEEAREHAKARCAEENATLNESEQRRCDKGSAFHGHALKARREAHALLGAIAAIERRIGKLEVREMALEDELATGNFTDNRTAESVQKAIAKIEEHQERLAERLAHLQERVEALHAKWAAVRDHVESRRHGGGDDEDGEEISSSSSSSSSESASTSESQTSTAPA